MRLLTVVLWLAVAGQAVAAELPPELWDRPRSAQAVMAQPRPDAQPAALQSRSDARLLIVHGTPTEAQLQAEELRAWLVALAVEGARLQLGADASAATIRLELID